jgi:dihydroxy-acid dehydratase
VPLSLDDVDAVARQVPLLLDCKPAGNGYMEDFHRAGGVPALMQALASQLDLSVRGVSGQELGELLRDVPSPATWQRTIRPLADPLGLPGGLAVLRGSLAPEGAVIKTAAATQRLLQHRGPALVLDSPEDTARLDDPELCVTPDHILVLRNAGPVAAGMPEAGSLPIPRRLARQGVQDMVRVSDGRMSGTAYGTIVLHCSPEAAVGGPLALVRDGDMVELDVPGRRLNLLIEEQELAARRAAFVPPPLPRRGWRRLYAQHVLQAHLGADLDVLCAQ